VKITTVPGAGTLTNNGVAVNAGDFISKVDIDAGKLVFTPALNANGVGYASFTFQVKDDGGTANGGADTDATPNTITINVGAINHAPAGTDKTITALEDTAHTFSAADFGFSDSDGNALLSVKITTVPGAGTLTNNGVAVNAGDFISKVDIDAGKLVFTPALNANGAGYASFTFQVRDDGGTANGGVDLDASANTITVNVTSVNDAPSGTDKTVSTNENTAHTFGAADFGFTDSDGNALLSVKITTVPGAGTLTNNGVTVNAGDFIAKADLDAGKLVFTPALNANGVGYASFTFQVKDDGGTTNGGIDTDATPNTITLNVGAINHAPAGTDKTIATAQNTAHTFSAADFGFTDADGNTLLSVKITTVPGAGTLTNNGVTVNAGDFIAKADLDAGKLIFTPALNATGAGYASFTFQVQDDGGTANGGVDSDASPNTITIDVGLLNHAPAGADQTLTTLENTPYTFSAGDFGFSDVDGNAFLSVKITTVPGAGTLTYHGITVNAGDIVTKADLDAGQLIFTPADHATGSGYASFSFQVKDDGGGVDTDASPNTITLNVVDVNHAPTGADQTLTLLEDSTYTFRIADFGFTDPNDIPGNRLQSILITSLPTAGTLLWRGNAFNAGNVIEASDIANGELTFTPGANANGSSYASFAFQVRDDGGTDHGGTDTDGSPNTLTLNVTPVNDAPAGADKTVTTREDTPYTLSAADFGFTDSDGNTLRSVKITTVPGAGTLTNHGTAVNAGDFITKADMDAGQLIFTPAANANGTGYARLSFQVQDDGGTDHGGIDLAPGTNTLTLNVAPVNDAPAGTDKSVTLLEDSSYTFSVADFGFTDPEDAPANKLLSVKIATLSGAGTLSNHGLTVTAGELIAKADIDTGQLVFTPLANDNGTGYARLSFQLKDDGGTANGGIDTDATPNTITLHVTAVNDAPTGTSSTVTAQDTARYVIHIGDLGFSDIDGNGLQAVRIDSLPGSGLLLADGRAVTAGDVISADTIRLGNLIYLSADSSGVHAWLGFQVQDDGTTANGGINQDLIPRTLGISIPASAVTPAPGTASGGNNGNGNGSTTVPPAPAGQPGTTSASGASGASGATGSQGSATNQGKSGNTETSGNQDRSNSQAATNSPGTSNSQGSPKGGPTAATTDPLVTLTTNAMPLPGSDKIIFTALSMLKPSSLGVSSSYDIGPLSPTNTVTGKGPSFQLQQAITAKKADVPLSSLTLQSHAADDMDSLQAPASVPQEQQKKTIQMAGLPPETAEIAATVTSLGMVWLVARKATLAASLIASVPAWLRLDPLPILGGHGGEEDEPEVETDLAERLFSEGGNSLGQTPEDDNT
jgi:cadherin-like protein